MQSTRRIYIHERLTAERPASAGQWTFGPIPADAQHVHDNLELLWNEQPVLLNVGGERVRVEQPQLFILPPLTPHIAEPLSASGEARPGVVMGRHLSFLERALSGAPDEPTLRPGRLQPEHTALVLPLARHLHGRLIESGDTLSVDLRQLAQGLLALLRDMGYRGEEPVARNLDPVQRALEVLYARYGDPDLHIGDLAQAADLSLAQFRRVFRQITGESPLSYLTRHRLEQAKLLLAQDAITVAAVARRVGFDSPGSFYKRYRQFYGISPRNRTKVEEIDLVAKTWAPPDTYPHVRKKKKM